MSQPKPRVLDVGQCNPDHRGIRRMLTQHFDVDVDRVMFVDDAMDQLARHDYQLVLINRLIFDDGADGAELIRRMKGNEKTEAIPVMLISNYQDAQDRAVGAGAVPGFGKAQLGDADSIAALKAYLPQRAS